MWLWGSLPFSWLFGIPFFGVFAPLGVVLAAPSLPLVMAMLVVLAGMGLAARSALNY